MDRLTAMKTFVEVANTGSFTQAATNLNLSRLQVSRHVRAMESWLEQRLLHRTTRSVSLTTVGAETLTKCQHILRDTAEMVIDTKRYKETLTGTIRLAAPIGLAQSILYEQVDAFSQLHPEVSIEIIVSDYFSSLVEERIDIAFRFTHQPDEHLIARKLLTLDYVLCASPAYLEKFGEPKDIDTLRQHNCLAHLALPQWPLTLNGQLESFIPTGNLKANDLNILISAALHHRGIVRLPLDLAKPLLKAHKLQPILTHYDQPQSHLWAVYLSRRYQLATVRQFIDFVAEHLDTSITVLDK